MKQNAFISKINDNLRNTLSSLKDQDRQNNLNLRVYPYQNIQDTFDTYFNLFDATPADIIDAVDSNDFIASIFFSSYYENNSLRQQWLETFSDVIGTRAELFTLCLRECLSTHNRPRDIEHQDTFREESFTLFKQLIEIGKRHRIFSQLDASVFYTKDALYQDYLIEQQLISVNFSLEQFLEFMDNYATDEKQRNAKTASDLFSTYAKDIVSYVNDTNLLEQLFDKKQFDKFYDLFFEQHYAHVDSQALQDAAFKILAYPVAQHYISKKINHNTTLLNGYDEAFIRYLDSRPEHLKQSYFNLKDYSLENNYIRYEMYSSDISRVVSLFNVLFSDSLSRRNHMPSEKMSDYFISQILHYNTDSENKQKAQYYLGSLLAIMGNNGVQRNGIEAHIVGKHADLLAYSFIPTWKNTMTNVQNVHEILKMVKNGQGNWQHFPLDSFNKKFGQILQNGFYQAFTKVPDNYRRQQEVVSLLNYVLDKFPEINVIDVLSADEKNPLWATYQIDYNYSVYQNKKNVQKTRHEYPLVFVLGELNGNNLAPFYDSEKLPALAALKYKGKNIINYLVQNLEPVQAKKLLLTLSEYPKAIKSLVIDNKPALKIVEEFVLKNPNDLVLQSMINFGKLNQVIDKVNEKHNKSAIISKTRKI